MKYMDAKKLHNEDEVIYKYNNKSLYVVETKDDVEHREVYVLCDDGNWYHHRTIKYVDYNDKELVSRIDDAEEDDVFVGIDFHF